MSSLYPTPEQLQDVISQAITAAENGHYLPWRAKNEAYEYTATRLAQRFPEVIALVNLRDFAGSRQAPIEAMTALPEFVIRIDDQYVGLKEVSS